MMRLQRRYFDYYKGQEEETGWMRRVLFILELISVESQQ